MFDKQDITRLGAILLIALFVSVVSIVSTTVVLLWLWLSSPEKAHEATPTARASERMRLAGYTPADDTGCADRVGRLAGLLAESANLAAEGAALRVELGGASRDRTYPELADLGFTVPCHTIAATAP